VLPSLLAYMSLCPCTRLCLNVFCECWRKGVIPTVPRVRRRLPNAWASSICPVRSMQPQPTSVVKYDGSIRSKSRRYVNQNRDCTSCRNACSTAWLAAAAPEDGSAGEGAAVAAGAAGRVLTGGEGRDEADAVRANKPRPERRRPASVDTGTASGPGDGDAGAVVGPSSSCAAAAAVAIVGVVGRGWGLVDVVASLGSGASVPPDEDERTARSSDNLSPPRDKGPDADRTGSSLAAPVALALGPTAAEIGATGGRGGDGGVGAPGLAWPGRCTRAMQAPCSTSPAACRRTGVHVAMTASSPVSSTYASELYSLAPSHRWVRAAHSISKCPGPS
jgi:hypothetical protein